ncbi:MAG: hypothetical protein QOF21_1017 [Actinomycetota bacterium]
MRSRYGLDLDPIQTDTSRTPPNEFVLEIQNPLKADPRAFIASGCRATCFYLDELQDHNVDPMKFARVLEFGVGLGRLMRHLVAFPAELYACDLTPNVLRYTESVLHGRVDCVESSEAPPLPYDDGFFDYVYANSVFTHIRLPLTREWIAELARIIRPGGTAIVSVFEANRYLGHLTEREFDEVEHGDGYYEWGDDSVLQTFSYMTPRRLAEEWGQHFDVLELRHHFRDQSHVVLRRP